MAESDAMTATSPRIPVVWWFLAGAALASVLFYRDFLFHSERLIFGTDMLLEGFPLRQFYVEEIRAGRGVPLWTPHTYAGIPFVAQLPGPIFYPTTLLYFVMPLYRAIGWGFVLHTFLSGAFGYFLARSFRLRPSAAVVCGASFMFTGYVMSHLYGGHDGRMFGMTLIALALAFLNRALESGEARWYGGLAVTVALQIFTPHTQVMYFSSLALSLFLVFHLIFRVRKSGEDRWKVYAVPIAGFGLAFMAAVAIGAAQLFPTLALLENATRVAAEQGYAFAASYALPPQELTALFLPDLISSLPGSYWGQNPIKLHTEYLGSVPLALALLAVAAALRPRLGREHRRVIGFLGVATCLGILFALGGATPVHRIAYAVVPMIGSLRAPAMMMGPVSVFVALLAAYGWEAVSVERESGRRDGSPVSWIALALLATPILLLGLAAVLSPRGLLNFALLSWYPAGWPRQPAPELASSLRVNGLFLLGGFSLAWGLGWAVSRRRIGEVALVAIVLFAVVDLGRIDARYLETRDAAAELEADPVLAMLQSHAGPGERVWAPALGGEYTYRPNRFMYYGVSSATGVHKFMLRPYARLVGGITPDEGLLRYPNLLALLGVQYLITPGAQAGMEALAESEGRYLYQIEAPPHAFFPAAIQVARDTIEALRLTRSNADPLALAIVEAEAGVEAPEAGRGTATIARYEPDLIELDVEAERAGLLAVSEIYHPGWRAYVDGVERHIWRTNVAFRGVEVPRGTHRLRFAYESRSYRIGVWLSLVTAVLVSVVIGLSWRRSGTRRIRAEHSV